MNLFTAKWPFYVSGTLLALLLMFSLYVFDNCIGLADGIVVISELCDSAVNQKALPEAPQMDWQIAMIIGIFFGALVAAVIAGKFKLEFFTEGEGSFTTQTLRTVGGGIAGGFLMMLGIQLSGDTVWGQWSAAIQLSSGAWVFLIGMLLTGSTLAILLERRSEGGGKSGSGGKTKAPTAPARRKK